MSEQEVDLLKEILKELKKNNVILEDIKNLFQKYDEVEILVDEAMRD